MTLSLALGLLGGLTAADSPSDLERVVAGKAAPEFRLPDASGVPHALSSHRGEPVIVVFYRGYW
jgi:cytochrome oxidase Cu insertion factor (SCO1/SenC/PrrC family)